MSELWQAILADFSNITSPSVLWAFVQILWIDLILAGDNAIVVGALAAGLPADQRKKVILIGIIAALVLRIFFALITTQLLAIIGLMLAGGLLLLWLVYALPRKTRTSDAGDASTSHVVSPPKSSVERAP